MKYLLLLVSCVHARTFCEKTNMPLELGTWRHDLKHLDSAVVENKPVSMSEGQLYVYENYFPGYAIKYVHVDNLAVKTCGASATIKAGGVGTNSVLIILHADTNQEIRSVVDIWGVKSEQPTTAPFTPKEVKNMKSVYISKQWRAVSHNTAARDKADIGKMDSFM